MTDSTNNENQVPETAAQNQPQQPQAHFELMRVYVKDSSIETPSSPACFTRQLKPEIKVEFDPKISKFNDDSYEVALRITATCKQENDTLFVCEVNQAGLFLTSGIPAPALEYLLCVTAPTVLFPYAREFVSNLVNRASFPPLNLAPINFDALFRVRKQRQAQAAHAAAQQAAPAANEEPQA